jgi:chromosome partitioning protein
MPVHSATNGIGAQTLTTTHGTGPLYGGGGGGAGDVAAPMPHEVREQGVWLAAGDLRLSDFEGIMPNA